MNVSASKSALLLSPCIRSFATGMREYRDEFSDTSKRDKGIAFHTAMDGYYSRREFLMPGDEEVHSWHQKAVYWSTHNLEPRCLNITSEVYVASNFTTGEVHVDETVSGRGYPDKPGFLPGTADLVCALVTGELLVADWKTGGSAGADKQLLSLAWGLRLVPKFMAEGVARPVRLAVLHAGSDGVLLNEWAVTEAELSAHADAMAFQLADIGVRNDPVPGAHCTQLYCPHLAYCPAITDVVKRMALEGGPDAGNGL